jgi:hypothetical protein
MHAGRLIAIISGHRARKGRKLSQVHAGETQLLTGRRDHGRCARQGDLEFDYVVIVAVNAASDPDQRWTRYMLHIGVTRAAHP